MDYYYDWRPYVSVAARRHQAVLALQKLAKKGTPISPVVIDGRKIAKTFWGKAWCDNLERYSDYANRLPRGRTYVRNGSVVDLQIAPGAVTAMVSGSSLYCIDVRVAEVPKARWGAVCRDCAGAIDSLLELLHGRFSDSVMTRICQEKTGLFPSPAEITFTCSCPDWASMCKHVAAVLYGIGARLDEKPDLLFALRKVDHQDLIAGAGKDLTRTRKGPKTANVLDSGDLSEMFGIDMAQTEEPRAQAARKRAAKKPVGRIDPPAARPEPPPRARPAQRKTTTSTAKKRLAVSTRMKKYWLARRKGKKPI
jgi:uncharacterized Zn finger protein